MKIDSSSIDLKARHSYVSKDTSVAHLSLTSATAATQGSTTTATLSSAAQALGGDSAQTGSVATGGDASQSPNLTLLQQLLEWLTGRPVKLLSTSLRSPSAGSGSANTGQGGANIAASYTTQRIHQESESTRVSIKGTVRTADGKEISLSLGLSMNRSYLEQSSVSVSTGKRQDPLVINFGGNAAQLRDQRFSFDLDGDGSEESLAQLASGSGYLAFDRNGNGRIDDGTELFGPASNSGFGELSALDSDGNGWIDENDEAFGKLSVWTPDGGSGSLTSLADAGVGALYTGQVSSPFELRGSRNSDLGAVTSTGLYLREDGSAGTLQEIDLTV